MVARAKASHIGGALSMADILAVLYGKLMQYDHTNPHADWRDRLILSKGHACTTLYAALAHAGFFAISDLDGYAQEGSRLMSHASHKVPGVEFSTGSLGHGLPFGVGKALAARRSNAPWRTFVIISDGELDEGSNWEAILFAQQHRLSNLVLIVDYNKIQSLGSIDDVLSLGDLPAKFRAFNWVVRACDGHNHQELIAAIGAPPVVDLPIVVLAHTIKGKGVSFMEGQLTWHYRSPDSLQLAQALLEIDSDSNNSSIA